MSETRNDVNVELLKAKLEAQKKDKLLHLIVGLFVGLIVGFFVTNWMNARPNMAAVPATQAAAGGELPPDHPAAAGDGAQAAMPEVQAKLKAADDNPQDYDAQMEAAAMFFRIGNFDRAATYLERATALKPKSVEPYAALAQVKIRQGALDEALVQAKKAHEISPDDYESTVLLANVYFDTEDFASARPLYEQALAKKPDDIDVRTDLGTTYFKVDELDKAVATYRESLKQNPTHENTLHNLAFVLIKKGDAAGAEETINKLAQVSPQNPSLTQLRADLGQLKTTGKIPTH